MDGMPTEAWSTEQLLRGLTSWANSVKVVSHDMEQGRSTWSLQWLFEVGQRIDAATDILKRRYVEQ